MRGHGRIGWLWLVQAVVAFMSIACTSDTARDEASNRQPLTVGMGPIAAGPAGVFTAADLGLFAARGLDVDFKRFTSATLCVSAMISGQVPVCVGISGIVLVNANLAGAELKGIAATVDTIPYTLMVSPDINVPADLVGKRLGINRPGTSADHALRLGLDHVGVDPQDVDLVSIGEQPQRLAALQAGSIDGTLIAPPGALQAQGDGFRILLDLSELGIAYPHNLVIARTDFLREQPAIVRLFLEGVAEGTFRFKADRDLGLRVLSRHLGVSDVEDLVGTYDMFSRTIPDLPLVSQEGMQALLTVLAETNDAIAGARPDDFLDMRIVRELQETRVLDRLKDRALLSTARHDENTGK